MGHGIARFSPNFCCDKMRFWSIGQSEAAVWDDLIFQQNDPEYLTTLNPQTGSKSRINERLRAYGLPVKACQNLLNPGATFFPISNAETFGLLYRLIISLRSKSCSPAFKERQTLVRMSSICSHTHFLCEQDILALPLGVMHRFHMEDTADYGTPLNWRSKVILAAQVAQEEIWETCLALTSSILSHHTCRSMYVLLETDASCKRLQSRG